MIDEIVHWKISIHMWKNRMILCMLCFLMAISIAGVCIELVTKLAAVELLSSVG